MKALYERLAKVLSSIEPRNGRARTWLNKLIIRCHANATTDLDRFANRAAIEGIRFDFQVLLIIQGKDAQTELYRGAEAIINELETASGLNDWETKLWQRG